jgi:chromate reductase
MHKVAVIVGSTRKESINRKLAEAIVKLAAGKLDLKILKIDDLPLFNQDDEANPPPQVTRFKNELAAADAVLFVTPEHNRSIPAAMKNAVDWGTRPPSNNSFKGKVGAITGASRGKISTAVAQQHLRNIILSHLSALLGAPEAYVQYTDQMIDASGSFADESTAKFLGTLVDNLARLTAAMMKT